MPDSSFPNPFLAIKVRTLFVWLILVSILLVVVLGLGLTQLKPDDAVAVLLIYIVLFSILSAWLLFEIKGQQGNLKQLVGQIPDNPRWLVTVGLVIAALMFSLGSFQILFYLLALVAPSYVESVLQGVAAASDPQTALPALYPGLNIFTTVIVAPITEELLFRGFILQRWATKWNLPRGLIMSSILFGVLHPNPIGLTIFGLLMGLLYIKTRSLLVPISCHALNNGVAIALQSLPTKFTSETSTLTLAELKSGLGLSVLLVAISAPFLIRFIANTFPRLDAEIPYLLNQAQR
ncbi:CPBP family intramembrane metalloprotease [Phormidium sp. CLA17]|uniref:CPBP family intramembrane glutamic endopeptidase n=1 Tax=Leptolyngbya sp. Cla-17 TaxID=2803751 RepID=UPI001492F5E6|nr:CPBP family intramembrane glutamic endopeptidase [Leptolyngbya sp. Cla-17]MBM0743165.1 CPBP family intramembrane metalloprotease [Leptolyngbya sp. Cla-17]